MQCLQVNAWCCRSCTDARLYLSCSYFCSPEFLLALLLPLLLPARVLLSRLLLGPARSWGCLLKHSLAGDRACWCLAFLMCTRKRSIRSCGDGVGAGERLDPAPAWPCGGPDITGARHQPLAAWLLPHRMEDGGLISHSDGEGNATSRQR